MSTDSSIVAVTALDTVKDLVKDKAKITTAIGKVTTAITEAKEAIGKVRNKYSNDNAVTVAITAAEQKFEAANAAITAAQQKLNATETLLKQ